MLTIYTTPSCSSCRKAKKWLEDYKIPYQEKNLFNSRITESDIDMMLENAENGFDDIISTRSKIFKEENLDIDSMRTNELKRFIIKNPSVLKRPIMIQDEKMQVGYNDDEIRIFIPRRLRELIDCSCAQSDCDYQSEVEKQIDGLRRNLTTS
ncbi:Spx/MgsR family RNA polymerase-binding regulatory protein [Acholeplasma sp. OttesenSCG-928-E16]|nr:Spx/MgsR family RNA polymerase-binding regulatory protein [Acholeplasma sp. OttesenSCG-928-E16]